MFAQKFTVSGAGPEAGFAPKLTEVVGGAVTVIVIEAASVRPRLSWTVNVAVRTPGVV